MEGMPNYLLIAIMVGGAVPIILSFLMRKTTTGITARATITAADLFRRPPTPV